jgi:hypothetical protein
VGHWTGVFAAFRGVACTFMSTSHTTFTAAITVARYAKNNRIPPHCGMPHFSSARILSTALSTTIITPIVGFIVIGGLMLISTTNKFFIPITLVFESTQLPILQLLLQCCTLPNVYGLHVLIHVVNSSKVEFLATLSGVREGGIVVKTL